MKKNIRLDIGYHPPEEPAVLTKHRIFLILTPDPEGNYYIDWIGIAIYGSKYSEE